MNPQHPSSDELFRRLLDESSALLAAPQGAGVEIPDDDLHHEILLPLLPAMLGDEAIRRHWHDRAATGFLARLTRHLQGDEAAPQWQPADFEIHVTASYNAGPDAKALADTLLSEDSLRDMSAALMNQVLAAVWPKLAPAAVKIVPAEVEAAAPPPAEPAGESVAAPMAMPMPALVAESFFEPAAESNVKVLAEGTAEPAGEPVAEPIGAPVGEQIAEPVAESVSDPVSATVAEPVAEPVGEPTVEAVAEPVAETVVEVVPAGEPATEPEPAPELAVAAEEPTPVIADAKLATQDRADRLSAPH